MTLRHFAFAPLLLLPILVACTGGAGDTIPDSDSTEKEASSTSTSSPPSSAVGNEKAAAERKPVSVTPPELLRAKATDSCWEDFGPSASGECVIGDERTCDGSGRGASSGSSSFCLEKCVNIKGRAVWGLQTTNDECSFYESSYRKKTAECACPAWQQQQGSSTPLVLAFDNQAVVFNNASNLSHSSFNLTRDGQSHGGDWPSASTPWLALDRNGNGVIDDGSELFGSATLLSNGRFAKNGFEALRDLDSDNNGVFDARDAAFSKVVVWTDKNADRASTPNELMTLEEAGVKSIDLLHDHLRDARMHCDDRGNCEGEQASFAFGNTARKGTVIDVYIKTSN